MNRLLAKRYAETALADAHWWHSVRWVPTLALAAPEPNTWRELLQVREGSPQRRRNAAAREYSPGLSSAGNKIVC